MSTSGQIPTKESLSRLSTYELQLRVDELRKRLSAMDQIGTDAAKGDDDDFRKTEEEKQTHKTAILALMRNAVNMDQALSREAKVVVNFPKLDNTKGGFSFELSGKSLTWTDIRDRACVMFGHDPDETLIMELREGQRVIVPGWVELKPGQHIDAEIVDKPPITVKSKSLKASLRRLNKYASSGASGGHGSSSGHGGIVQFPSGEVVPVVDVEAERRQQVAARREIIFDFFLHITLFILLAVGLIDPISQSNTLRWFDASLAWLGQMPFNSTRGGNAIILSLDSNVTSMSEAWDWINGPLTHYLVGSSAARAVLPLEGTSSPEWFGYTPPDACPVTLHDQPPLCTAQNFSIPPINRARWLTNSVSTEILGAVRLRQFRVRPNSCASTLSNGQQLFSSCFADYSSQSRDTASYGPGVCGFEWRSERELASDRPGAPRVQGDITSYDSSGFVLDVATSNQWIPALEYLLNNSWITPATKAIIIEFTVHNPNAELFASVRALIEMDQTGSARTSFDVAPMRVPSSCSHCEVRFITDIIALILIVVLLVRVLLGGFFYKPKQRLWRTYDFLFSLTFIASFIVDMVVFASFPAWQQDFSASSTMYWSLDEPHYLVESANRFRAVIILLITFRFFLQGTFSFSRLARFVFSRLFCIYVLLLVLLIPFMSALAILVMVLEQGSPDHVVSFGNGLRDIFLIVTGVTDRLTAATPRVGRQTGWSIVFYLFLIAFTWVLVVPTLIAFAVITYERAAEVKDRFRQHVEANAPKDPNESLVDSRLVSIEKDIGEAIPLSNASNLAMRKAMLEELDYDPDDERSAAQVLAEACAHATKKLV